MVLEAPLLLGLELRAIPDSEAGLVLPLLFISMRGPPDLLSDVSAPGADPENERVLLSAATPLLDCCDLYEYNSQLRDCHNWQV